MLLDQVPESIWGRHPTQLLTGREVVFILTPFFPAQTEKSLLGLVQQLITKWL